MTERTLKLRNRIYHPVPIADVQAGDAVVYVDDGRRHTRFVARATATHLLVEQPKGFKPKTKRVYRIDVKEVWRWHKRTK